MKQSLAKTDRLKSYTRIRQLFAAGQKLRVPPLLVYYVLREPVSHEAPGSVTLQMGVSVGARHFKRAVDRNLLKRRIREAYRKQKNCLVAPLTARGLNMDLFFVYIDSTIADYATLNAQVEKGLNLLKQKILVYVQPTSVSVRSTENPT
jgi:ribonuclease P protein component